MGRGTGGLSIKDADHIYSLYELCNRKIPMPENGWKSSISSLKNAILSQMIHFDIQGAIIQRQVIRTNRATYCPIG